MSAAPTCQPGRRSLHPLTQPLEVGAWGHERASVVWEVAVLVCHAPGSWDTLAVRPEAGSLRARYRQGCFEVSFLGSQTAVLSCVLTPSSLCLCPDLLLIGHPSDWSGAHP